MTKIVLLAVVLGLAAGCDRTPPRGTGPLATAPAAGPVYQCAMHPQIVRREPGTCPICGMPLQRVEEAATDAAGASGLPDHAAFVLSPRRQQLIGVTKAVVGVRALTRTLRVPATVANDPALYEALIEYREARRTRGAIGRTTLREASAGADALVRAAALKLRRLGLGDREVDTLAALDPTTLILPGPRVWIYAQVFEEDATLVRAGMPIVIEAPSTGRTYESTVLAVDPTVAADTRTVRVRALVTTPEGDLRPDAYATATIHVPLGERLAVPREAVLDAGARRLAFVVSDDGHFTPRELRLGRSADGWLEVLDGVVAGEQVVTSANFLIDSESRLKAALAAFGAAPAHAH
jgi:membrane fusion protein, copper/silver efflux system